MVSNHGRLKLKKCIIYNILKYSLFLSIPDFTDEAENKLKFRISIIENTIILI